MSVCNVSINTQVLLFIIKLLNLVNFYILFYWDTPVLSNGFIRMFVVMIEYIKPSQP